MRRSGNAPLAGVTAFADDRVSAIVSSVVLGVVHIDVIRPIVTIVFGLIAAALYEKSGSLWPAIVLHLATNLVYLMVILS